MVLGITLGIWGTLLSIIAILSAIWVIYDVWAKQKRMKDLHKVVWTVFAIIFSILTAIVYYFVRK